MFSLPGERVEVIYLISAGVVEAVLFWSRDIMTKLPVADWNLDWYEALVRPRKSFRISEAVLISPSGNPLNTYHDLQIAGDCHGWLLWSYLDFLGLLHQHTQVHDHGDTAGNSGRHVRQRWRLCNQPWNIWVVGKGQ